MKHRVYKKLKHK